MGYIQSCCWFLYVLSHFSHVQLFATQWTVARQAPRSTGDGQGSLSLPTEFLNWSPVSLLFLRLKVCTGGPLCVSALLWTSRRVFAHYRDDNSANPLVSFITWWPGWHSLGRILQQLQRDTPTDYDQPLMLRSLTNVPCTLRSSLIPRFEAGSIFRA